MKPDDLIAAYVRLRDHKSELAEKHKKELLPLDEAMHKIEGLLSRELEKAGAQSIKTPHGTAYKQTWTSARVRDWSQTLDYIVETERFDLLERRVNKTVVLEIGEVPGVEVDTGVSVNIRRS